MGGTPETYRFAAVHWMFCAIFGAVTLLVIVWTVNVALTQPIGFVLFWCSSLLVLGWIWFHLLVSLAYEVRYWPEDGRVVFRSVLREKSTTLTRIASIRRGFSNRTLVVRYDDGSTKLPPVGPMLDFVRDAHEGNPAVFIQGV